MEAKSSSDETYNITKRMLTRKIEKKGSSSSTPTVYYAFASTVGTDTYLNLYEESADPKLLPV